jgi:anti-sigma B factor antagonist
MHWTEITDRTVGSTVILDVRGHMTLGEQESHLFRHVSALADAGCRRIVLNLQHVSYVDSVGVGEIIRVYLHLQRRGGMLRLCGIGPRVSELLETTQLDRVLPISESEADAVASLEEGRY